MALNTMQAWRVESLGAPEQALVLRELPIPEPGPGEVLLRVRTASLGFPDVLFCQGRYQLRPELPFVLGSEVCADVVGGERVQQTMVEIGRLCAERRLVPLVGGIVPMADAAAALQALAAGGTMGRTVVDVWQ
jgi:NADPH2:quinone reductase